MARLTAGRKPWEKGANKLIRAQRGETKVVRGRENLKSEGNGEKRLREGLPPVLRGTVVLQRQFSTATAGRTRRGELKCSTFEGGLRKSFRLQG